jgi:predicted ribosomally synthesized peptide with SipW-like signal peptide
MVKTVLMSLLVIGVVGGMVGGGLFAHFQDTETSEGNTFTAGFIDLTIDNTAYPGEIWNGTPFPLFSQHTDWKPCTHYEATLSLHLVEGSNDCPVFMNMIQTLDDENVRIEPEVEAGDTTAGDPADPNDGAGELDNYVMITIWIDEGSQAGWQGPTVDPEEGDNKLNGIEVVLKRGLAKDILPIAGLEIGTLVACTVYYIGIDVHFQQLDDQDVSDAMTDQWGCQVSFDAIHP